MARLSGYLTGQLANPSYAGMLGSNIQGGMQGISDSIAARKQRDATDSALAMLTGADPNDPNVVSSVQAVMRQMGQDPTLGQSLIQNAQGQSRQKAEEERAVRGAAIREQQLKMAMEDQKRQEEQMQMAREDQARQEQAFKFQIADAQWQQKLRNDAIEEENVLTAAITEYNKTGDAEKTLKMVPPQHQDVVQQAISGKQKAEQEAQEFKEYIAAAQVIPEDTLKAYEGKSETVKLAVQTYRDQIKGKTVPRLAAQTLHSIIEADSKARLYRTEDDVKAPKVPSKTDVDLAKKQIASLVGDQNGDSWLWPPTWGQGEVEAPVLEIAAHDLATRLKNGEALSEELVTSVVQQAKTGAPPPGKTNPEGYKVQPTARALSLLASDPSPEALAEFEEYHGALPEEYRK